MTQALQKLRDWWSGPGPDPVVRLSREQLEARADHIAREWLYVTRDEAFGMLDRGELAGMVAEPELEAVRDMLRAIDEHDRAAR